MSFDMNPMGNLSNVQKTAKSMEGGGGNTGYFSRQGEENEENLVEFAKDYPSDTFEKVTIDDIEQSDNGSIIKFLIKLLKNLILKIKRAFKK